MNKQELIELGLDETQAEAVIGKYTNMIPQSRLKDKVDEVNQLQQQLAERDTQLEELKPKLAGQEALLKQIDDLQLANQTTQQEFAQKLRDTQLTNAIKLALNGKVHDLDIVTSLLDKSSVELDDHGNLVRGLDEQLEPLKESKSFLFVHTETAVEEPPKPQFSAGNPNPPEARKRDLLAERLARIEKGI